MAAPKPEVVVQQEPDAGAQEDSSEEPPPDSAADADAAADASGADAGADGSGQVIVALAPTPQVLADGGTEPGAAAGSADDGHGRGRNGHGPVIEVVGSCGLDSQPVGAGIWSTYDGMGQALREQGQQVLFAVRVVDGAVDARPPYLQGSAWNDPSCREGIHSVIDRTFESFGDELRYLSFAMEVDRFFETRPGERAAFEEFATDAMAYARSHAASAGPPSGWRNLVCGAVGCCWRGMPRPRGWQPSADAPMVAYEALDATLHALPPAAIATDLQSLAAVDPTRALVLHQVAYGSSALVNATPQAQAQFLDELFSAVSDYRGRIAFIGVFALQRSGTRRLQCAWFFMGRCGGTSLAFLVQYGYAGCAMALRSRLLLLSWQEPASWPSTEGSSA